MSASSGSRWARRAQEALRSLGDEDPDIASTLSSSTVLLHGSTTRGIDDTFSDLDVWVLPPEEHPRRFIEFAVDGKPGQVQIESRHDFVVRIERCEFPLIFELRHAIVLQDSDGWGEGITHLARRPMPADVRSAWFTYHYIEMRSEHRACDNPIEREDAAAVLLGLTATLEHAMQAAVVLDGEPYPYKKWLASSVSNTPTGKGIAPLVEEVLALIGSGALRQGGPERQHPLNIKLREIRQRLIDAARANGHEGAWLTDWYLHLDLRDRRHNVAWR